MYEQRSLLNFAVLIVFAVLTAVYLVRKANEAVSEINALSNAPIFLGTKNLK